jgi:hypothetical protein
MNKIIIFLLGASALFANNSKIDGYDVYKNKCQKCHVEMMDKSVAIKNLKELKAPPMVEVSNRLKENIIIKDDDDDVKRRVVIAFIKDYIDNPSLEYSMCNAMAIERFDIMPSLKGKINSDEKQAVAEWVYDRYDGIEFK